MRLRTNWISPGWFYKEKMRKVSFGGDTMLRPKKKLYKFFGLYEWYSLCGIHFSHNEKCHMCRCGGWVNRFDHAIESYFHNNHYKLWHKWKNSKKQKGKWLRKLGMHFPNLK